MRIQEVFETRVDEKIEPVIKVGERGDDKKLAAELGSYVVTPTIEKHLDDFLEQYTETVRKATTEVGVWISGYFGSGKSHLAKTAGLLVENRILDGISAVQRFEPRLPSDAPRRASIIRSLSRVSQCDTSVLAFNLNTLSDSKATPLPKLLLSQFYQSKGYGGNFVYARVIEAELDKRGKLNELHRAAERIANRPWAEMQKNLGFYARPLYEAASEVAKDVFPTSEDVAQSLRNAERGELYNVQFFVDTVLQDIDAREKVSRKPCRFVLVLDESGQWIEDDGGRLAQLQSLVEEAAIKGQGKIWIFVTTHEDMGSIYQNARALKGDMKKIEGRFRFKISLTTENIEAVLEDRLLRKTLAGQSEIRSAYNRSPGVLRDLGQLSNTNQQLPECTEERFLRFYPFFPYQVHLIPEIVKSLRSAGGRGEQLSGSTRTLLAITQDILRAGRRNYLSSPVGEMVSFDEVYNNLAGEGEVSADARREIGRIEAVVPQATALTRRVAEVLYLIREIAYIPRTIDNIARLMVEHTGEDLASIVNRIKPELDKLVASKLVAQIGEDYEFLTGERRTFEEAVSQEMNELKWQDLQQGLSGFPNGEVIGFQKVPYSGEEFAVRISFDGTSITRDGFIQVQVTSPLSTSKLSELEDQSLRSEEQNTIFLLSDRVPMFDRQLRYYLAMKGVIDRWKGDPNQSEEAHKLVAEREGKDLAKLRNGIIDSMRIGLKKGQLVFRGAARSIAAKPGQSAADTLRTELSQYWPTLYPKFDKVPVRIPNEQRAILDVLKGAKEPGADVRALNLFDKSGQLQSQSPLVDAIRVFLATRQSNNERTLGRDLIGEFEKPPYGWDPAAVRVGVAAMVRSALLRVLINKKAFSNPGDQDLQDALRTERSFEKVELVLEETEIDSIVLSEARQTLLQLTGKRKIDETPASISAEMEMFARPLMTAASKAELWAEGAGVPLPGSFNDGKQTFEAILAITNPIYRTAEIHAQRSLLDAYAKSIQGVDQFVDKSRKALAEMKEFAGSLAAVQYKLPARGSCANFMENWRTALKDGSIFDPDTWRQLQDARATARIEMEDQVTAWRDNVRQTIQAALDRLPADLRASQLEDLQDDLSKPLDKFVLDLGVEVTAAGVAALESAAERLVRDLTDAIQDEMRKRSRRDTQAPPRPVKRVKLIEVAGSGRVQSEAQWEILRDRLDSAVRRELSDGNEVEIS